MNKKVITVITVITILVIVSVVVVRTGIYISFPDFVDVEFECIQPSEGKMVFSHDGYLYEYRDDGEYKYKYTYNKMKNVISAGAFQYEIVYYSQENMYVYTRIFYENKQESTAIIKTEETERNLFIKSDDDLDINGKVKIDDYIVYEDGRIERDYGDYDYGSRTSRTEKCSRVCLVDTDYCNFYSIYGNVYERVGDKYYPVY